MYMNSPYMGGCPEMMEPYMGGYPEMYMQDPYMGNPGWTDPYMGYPGMGMGGMSTYALLQEIYRMVREMYEHECDHE